ncbi:MAG: glutathione synthase [Methylacidiphilales bacterium]|nr:glutathione synthase [Candidatus Methylacidiphilales bacterium]
MRFLIIADPINTLQVAKDTTIGIIHHALERNWICHYATSKDLMLSNSGLTISSVRLSKPKTKNAWYHATSSVTLPANTFDFILVRKDPPCDLSYTSMLLLLAQAEQMGVPVYNSAIGMLSMNEKINALTFRNYSPQTLISANYKEIMNFISTHRTVVIKPLWKMGGEGVFKVNSKDSNGPVLIQMLLTQEPLLLIQKFIAGVTKGDRRIFVINGKAFDRVIVRVPKAGEHRANMAAGGTWHEDGITEHEKLIVGTVSPFLIEKGIIFAGLDIISGFLTEINYTSPTCARQLSKNYQMLFFKSLLDQLHAATRSI